MYSRVTQLEIDTVRIGVEDAMDVFKQEVLPRLHEQEGFRGVVVLATPAGQAMLVSFWETEEAADSSAETGFYPETLARYVTLFRAPPGREHYAVAFAEVPVLAID